MTDKTIKNPDSSAKTVRCPHCGSEYSGKLQKCPVCGRSVSRDRFSWLNRFLGSTGDQKSPSRVYLPAIIGACLMLTAFTAGITLNISANARDVEPVSTPEVFVLASPLPVFTPAPTPTPEITSIKLYAFGRELDADGFTAYVGDKPFSISVELEPQIRYAPVSWFISDSASLSVSDDGLSCEFTALKPTGKNELTVSCYGAETTIPVYLWER